MNTAIARTRPADAAASVPVIRLPAGLPDRGAQHLAAVQRQPRQQVEQRDQQVGGPEAEDQGGGDLLAQADRVVVRDDLVDARSPCAASAAEVSGPTKAIQNALPGVSASFSISETPPRKWMTIRRTGRPRRLARAECASSCTTTEA